MNFLQVINKIISETFSTTMNTNKCSHNLYEEKKNIFKPETVAHAYNSSFSGGQVHGHPRLVSATSQLLWYMPVVLAMQEAIVRKLSV
jgi:hypothetical protein